MLLFVLSILYRYFMSFLMRKQSIQVSRSESKAEQKENSTARVIAHSSFKMNRFNFFLFLFQCESFLVNLLTSTCVYTSED